MFINGKVLLIVLNFSTGNKIIDLCVSYKMTAFSLSDCNILPHSDVDNSKILTT